MASREYSKRLGAISDARLQAALDRFGLGKLVAAQQLVAGIDAFIFEARSGYEILGAVVREIVGNILGKKVDERALRAILETKSHDTRWIDDLHDERITFFHRTAPWEKRWIARA